jgi:hypothetical protein
LASRRWSRCRSARWQKLGRRNADCRRDLDELIDEKALPSALDVGDGGPGQPDAGTEGGLGQFALAGRPYPASELFIEIIRHFLAECEGRITGQYSALCDNVNLANMS